MNSQTGKETQLRSQVNNKISEIIIFPSMHPDLVQKCFHDPARQDRAWRSRSAQPVVWVDCLNSMPLVPIVWVSTLCSDCDCRATVVTPDVAEFPNVCMQEVFRDDGDILSQVVVPDSPSQRVH